MNFDLITTLILSLVTFILFATNLFKVKKIRTVEFFSFGFLGSAIFINTIEYYLFFKDLSLYKFIEFRSMSVISMHAIFLATLSLLSIENLNSKKIKTIWRLPILGFLMGFFAYNFHLHIHLGIGLITLFVYLKNRYKLRILMRVVTIHLACLVGFLATPNHLFWMYNLILIIYLLNLRNIWDMLRLKQMSAEAVV